MGEARRVNFIGEWPYLFVRVGRREYFFMINGEYVCPYTGSIVCYKTGQYIDEDHECIRKVQEGYHVLCDRWWIEDNNEEVSYEIQ